MHTQPAGFAYKRDLAELPSKPLRRVIIERNETGLTMPVRGSGFNLSG